MSFLARWSRLKSASRSRPGPAHPAPTDAVGTAVEAAPEANPVSEAFDLLSPEIPADVRRAALRRLWSEPDLVTPDGLIDYAGNYAGEGMDSDPVATAWQVGRGLLSEAEAAVWMGLGASPTPIARRAAPADADADEADGERRT